MHKPRTEADTPTCRLLNLLPNEKQLYNKSRKSETRRTPQFGTATGGGAET
ncbi:hypothetical protein JYU34_000710 [Plutella xylostella]|uniref:Uncharacterized protein n=1 Tax=Plutella xylostella TaxID=51655 RepID=A0ABQ7R8E2_PLUXY|nr:hypothetical protein JYU34_000710 [Plutella xylostella]